MPCHAPIPAERDGERVQLHPPLGRANLWLNCGSCLGCRQLRAAQWGLRAMAEARRHRSNVFVTLTYDDAHVSRSLVPEHLSLWLKRLRRAAAVGPLSRALVGPRIRYLASGEYGDTYSRPHYHALLFGLEVRDGYLVKKQLYESPSLSATWGKGQVRYGAVTAASAMYVAQYNCKSQVRVVTEDGEELQRPFLRMSRRPGLGAYFVEEFPNAMRQGFIYEEGKKHPIPRAYLRRLDVLRSRGSSAHASVWEDLQARSSPSTLSQGNREAEEFMLRSRIAARRRDAANSP